MEYDQKKWEDITEMIRLSNILQSFQFDTWIATIERVHFKEKTLFIWAPSPIAVKILNKQYLDIIKEYVYKATKKEYEICILEPNAEMPAADGVSSEKKAVQPAQVQDSNLNPKYTFSTFVVGSSNKLAHAYSLSVAEVPGERTYNPLFIYGGAGLGKTHLSQAIGHFMRERNGTANIIYVAAETYTNEYIKSLQNKTTERFREKYRNADLLIVDDIQFISGKEATITEFFHTFNDLYQKNKQIVLTSDRPPKQLKNIDERLVSRFNCGITCDITKPDYETRFAILKNNCAAAGVTLDDEIYEFIAKKVKSNVRELEGALNRIIVYEKLKIEPLTLTVAERILKDFVFTESDKNLTYAMIKQEVANYFGIEIEDIMGKKKVKNIVTARQIAMFIAFNKVKNTNVTTVAREFERDHSTISHAVEKISAAMGEDEEISTAVRDIISKLTDE